MLRLKRFYGAAFIHMLFYRILIFVAPITAVFILVGIVSGYPAAIFASRILILASWILFAPQLFAALKAFSLVSSKGTAFGRFSEPFARLRSVGSSGHLVYNALPYVGTLIWTAGFAVIVFAWFV